MVSCPDIYALERLGRQICDGGKSRTITQGPSHVDLDTPQGVACLSVTIGA
jgi:hypothetical protein